MPGSHGFTCLARAGWAPALSQDLLVAGALPARCLCPGLLSPMASSHPATSWSCGCCALQTYHLEIFPACFLPLRADCVSSSSGCLLRLLLPGSISELQVPMALVFLTITPKTKPTHSQTCLLFGLFPLGPWGPGLLPCLFPHLIHHKELIAQSSWCCLLSFSQPCPLVSCSITTDLVPGCHPLHFWLVSHFWSGPCLLYSIQQPECPFTASTTLDGEYFPWILTSIVDVEKSAVGLTRIRWKRICFCLFLTATRYLSAYLWFLASPCWLEVWTFICLFMCLAVPTAGGSSQARDRTCLTRTAAVTTLDP